MDLVDFDVKAEVAIGARLDEFRRLTRFGSALSQQNALSVGTATAPHLVTLS